MSQASDLKVNVNTVNDSSSLVDKNKRSDKDLKKKKAQSKAKKTANASNPSKHTRRGLEMPGRGHSRMGQHRRQQHNTDSIYRRSHGEDLDLSIQEELMGGNFKMKGKKAQMSINHLLDFNLPEVERETINTNRRRNQRKKGLYEEEHINLSGDAFINVNYRLLIKEGQDYVDQLNNPNAIIDDENIVAVIVPSGQSCPICLCEKPIAPRMVGCGHIFCYACLLNFFSIDDTVKDKTNGYVKKKKYKECPLCNNIVRPHRVKQVVYLEDSDLYLKDDKVPTQGDRITLDLMYKSHDSIFALPVKLSSSFGKISGHIPNIVNNSTEARYSRLVKCSSPYALKLLNDDIEAIQTQHEIDQALYNDDDKFSSLAIEQINNMVLSILSANEDILISSVKQLTFCNANKDPKNLLDDEYGYFFYETSHNTATKFFLSPLDVKILLSIFEKYSSFPPELRIEVENIHYDTVVTESLIRRYKYMSYLPLGTEVAFLDINWKDVPFLTVDVYAKFKTELKQRRRELNMKKQREDRNKKLYDAKLEEEIAAFYRAENGDSYTTFEEGQDYKKLLESDIMLDTLWSKEDSNSSNMDNNSNPAKKKGYRQNTVWGTSIAVIPDEKSYKEDEEFATMLLQKIQGEGDSSIPSESDTNTPGPSAMSNGSDVTDSSNNGTSRSVRKGKKKKGKVVLFST